MASALRTVEQLLHGLHSASGIEFAGLGSEFRDSEGELLSAEFTTSNPNPYSGTRETIIQADGSQSSALFAAPAPCTGGSSLTTIPQNLATGMPALMWNYSPSLSISTSTLQQLKASYFNSICIYFEADLAGLNINTNTALLNKYSAALKTLKVPTLTGFTCHNCFAYVGASLKVALTCTVGGALNTCHFALAGGGGAQLNLDLRLENPTLSGDTGDVLLWNATSYATLYSNPAAFLKIKARPFLFTRLNGHLAATGTASLTASFNSSCGVQIVASSPVSIGNADAGLSGHLSMKRPTFTSTLQVVDATLEASFTPLVMWDFEVGEVVSILGKNTGFTSSITAGTAISARYNYIERAPTGQRELLTSASSCSSNHRVTVSASLQGINEKLILQGSATTLNLLSAYLNTGDQLAMAALPGNTCISGPSPSTTPTPGPQDASQALGLSNLNGTERQLSTGTIAIVVLLPLLFLVFAVVLLRNWCKKKGADS